MKKIIKIIVPLVLIFVCVTGAFAQGTLSEEILNQAKREAGLFLELKSALGLDWLDEYNAYLENPTSNPEPSWDLSVADLVNGGYLSDSFPSDFTITKAGQEVKISRIITSQAMKDVLPIYLPSVTIAGDVVSLIVQRPEQWVAWQAGLLGKVSRDGSDNPDILPNAVLDFGKGSEIRFINDDGKLTGIENLIYRDDELDDRFVNTSGDDEMSGTLTAGGFKVGNYIVWHEGNDGHREDGSGLDADLLDGQHGSYYLDAKNLTGIVPPERLKGTYDIDILGNAATATYASNSDKLDDYDSDHFATADHDHDGKYLIKTKPEGDTMMGKLTASQFQGNIYIPDTRNDTINPGDLFQESRIDFKFANILEIPLPKGYYYTTITMRPWKDDTGGPAHQIALGDGDDIRYRTGTQGSGWSSWNKIWHSGNDGSGSGLDADLLDGKHASGFLEQPIRLPANTNLNNIMTPGMYYTPLDVDAKTMANRPTDYAFSLLVEKHAGVKQTLTEYLPNNLARTWFRNYYNGTWGPWISFRPGTRLRVVQYTSPGSYTWTKGSGTKYVKVFVWGGGGGASWISTADIHSVGSSGGSSSFGNYVTAYGGKSNCTVPEGGSFSGISGVSGVKGGNGGNNNQRGMQSQQYGNLVCAHGGYWRDGGSWRYYGGGAGGYATLIMDVTAINSVTVEVGSGGSHRSAEAISGLPGAVIVEEYDGPPMG